LTIINQVVEKYQYNSFRILLTREKV